VIFTPLKSGIGGGGGVVFMDWIDRAQDRDRWWQALVNVAMDLPVP
jgi:hypothetical protein